MPKEAGVEDLFLKPEECGMESWISRVLYSTSRAIFPYSTLRVIDFGVLARAGWIKIAGAYQSTGTDYLLKADEQ
jgi:hypothetical protein